MDLVILVDKSNSMTLGQPGKDETPGSDATRDPTVPGNPRFPTSDVPGPRPTRDPGLVPRGEPGDEASLARVRGLGQIARPTRTGVAPGQRPTQDSSAGTRTPGANDQINRGEVEPAGTEDNIRAMQESVAEFLEHIEDDVKAGKIRVALVNFDDRARTMVGLTDNVGQVRSQLLRLRGGGNSRLDLGLQAAQRELVGANVRGRTDLDHTKVIIAWTDGKVDPRTVARLRTRDNVKVMAAGVGRGANQGILRKVASEPTWAFDSTDLRDLVESFYRISPNVRAVTMETLDVTEVLAGNLELVPDSANPAPAAMPDAKTLTWHFEPPVLPMTFTYRVRPLEAGTLPVNAGGSVKYKDSEDRSFDLAFPELKIEVLQAGSP
jgi:uncharacterized protein YegL